MKTEEDWEPSEAEAIGWIESLPTHLGDRFKGLSEGTGIPFERIANWGYVEYQINHGCSSILCWSRGKIVVGHNNDTFVPAGWGYATIMEIRGRIPTMCFGLAGDIWTTVGINQTKLWLHIDHLRVDDSPNAGKIVLPTYAFIVEALERSETIKDVRRLLDEIDRTEGMILLAVDGETNEAAVFECACSSWRMAEVESDWMVRTNHAMIGLEEREVGKPLDTWGRYNRLVGLLTDRYMQGPPAPIELREYLGDDEVERRGEDFATASSIIACPADTRIHYTFGGHPAASTGNWSEVEWPWP